MPKDKFQADQLLEELHIVENLLETRNSQAGLIALVRLIQSNSNWTDLLNEQNLDQWLALPLGQDKFPALDHLQKQLARLNFQKDHDYLTNLLNRRAFDQALTLEIERATRAKVPLSLALVDLDNFKTINDSYGHPCGDVILQSLATILLKKTRKIDTVARIGGEEFALLLPGTGLTRAQKLLERLLENIRQAKIYCDHVSITFTCSMGVASYRGKAVPDPGTLMAEADKALYAAKKSGKNRIETAPLLDLGQEPRQTLVHHDEKRFLFASFYKSLGEATNKD